ncbi:MAG TPA: Holliday junction resolvase RuvX [Gammaproteobacteria bacterium]|jgi:putative Holliday junction resolvase
MPEAWRLLLAFDFGLKRIGVATANVHTRTASPLTTLSADDAPPWQDIDALIAEWQPDLIVIGDPGPDANPGLRKALDAFVGALDERYSIPVSSVDESFTSSAAEAELRADRRKGIYNQRLRREQIDQQAACLIAEQWMNQAVE